jgi:hypothetical protein
VTSFAEPDLYRADAVRIFPGYNDTVRILVIAGVFAVAIEAKRTFSPGPGKSDAEAERKLARAERQTRIIKGRVVKQS